MKDDQEFWVALTIWGGIIFSCLMVIFAIGILAIGVKKNLKRRQLIKELYDKKERENGQHKGGARGTF